MRGRVRLGVALSLFAVSGLLAGGFFFPRAGEFLVVEDRFTHGETALMLSGDPVHRALAVRDLYRQGKIDRILIIPEPPDPVEGELARLGLLDPKLPPWSERILVASGVPRANIAFLPEPADGTLREALLVRKSLKGKPPKSLVLVTSKFASRRARFIFRHLLKHEKVTVFVYPNPHDPSVADRWWSQPRNALHVVVEYQKFLTNGIQLALGNLLLSQSRPP